MERVVHPSQLTFDLLFFQNIFILADFTQNDCLFGDLKRKTIIYGYHFIINN